MALQDEAEDLEQVQELQRLQRKWKTRIERREPAYREYWTRADKVVERFEDERKEETVPKDRKNERRYNILWANTETLKPVLFNKVPDPVVKRRWSDDNPVARMGAEVLERVSTFNAQRDDVYFVDHTNACVFNILVPGTGVLWARYEQETMIGPGGMMQVGDQRVVADYVHWRDIMMSKANVFSQVTWISRDLWMTPMQVAQRWGADAAIRCQPERKEGEEHKPQKDECQIKEIWDKDTKTVLFFNKHSDRILEVVDDPLRLSCFFPCPRPLFAVRTTQDVIPIPYFCQYQDQANELDKVTTQIYTLLRACKVVGAYNEEMGADFQQMLTSGNDNVMVPITDWPSFTQGGQMTGNVAMLDLRQVVDMLVALFNAREGIKSDLNEVTGIPDMFRGISSPLDAEGTNQLKVQWGASRVRDAQRDIQRFCRDFMTIAAEIAAEHFTPENLMRMSGIRLMSAAEKQQLQMGVALAQQTQQPVPEELQEKLEEPTVEDIVTLLRSEKLRGYMLDIESDSTIEGDDAKERESRGEFIEVLTGMVERWGPIVERQPALLPMVKELIMFAIQPFRAGRGLEEQIERTFDQLERMAKQAAQSPQPTDMDKALQQDMQKTMIQEQGDTQREAMQQAGETQRKIMDIGAKEEETRVRAVVDLAKEVGRNEANLG